MITAKGKTFIKKYLAGQAGNLVGAISVGIGNTAETLNDTKLVFEFARVPVTVIAYDFLTDSLVFKGSLDESVSGKIYEVGIWTSETNSLAGAQGSKLITSFDAATEDWTSETTESTIARIGPDSLKHTPAASATSVSTLSGLTLDFSDNSSADSFVLAYNVDNANTASVKLRMYTDASNYYEFTITTPTTGYKFQTFTKGSATVVGTPSWGDIGMIEMRTTATAGGSASVEYDGIRLEDLDTINAEYGLIARYVPATPDSKLEGTIFDVEFSLAVSV